MRPIFPPSAPIVCAHYVAIGSPIDSFAASSTWSDVATVDELAPAPNVADTVERTVSASVLAWRARYYAFRNARARLLSGNASAARAILAGEHGDYVRRRFAVLARTDDRFALGEPARSTVAKVDAPRVDIRKPVRKLPRVAPVALPARADTPEQSSPTCAAIEEFRRACEERAAELARTCKGKCTINRSSLHDGLAAMRKAMSSVRVAVKGRKVTERPRAVRLRTVGDVLEVSAPEVRSVSPVMVAEIQIDRPMDIALSDIELLSRIVALEPADTLGFSAEGGELHIRSDDAHYKLFWTSPDEITSREPQAAPLSLAQWLAVAYQLAEAVTVEPFGPITAEAFARRRAFDLHLSTSTAARRRKLALTLAGRTCVAAASAADHLAAAVGADAFAAWIDRHLSH